MKPLRTIFAATGDIAIPTLRHIVANADLQPLALLTGEDKPVGRRRILTPPQIKLVAASAGLPVHQPARLRHPDTLSLLHGLQPDLILVMAYGQLVPQSILDLPPLGCWNLHASLLPRHRGASPIQAAIAAGDTSSGITVMQMDAGLDTGPSLCQLAIPLAPDETGESLHTRLAELAPRALQLALDQLASGSLQPSPQPGHLATHSGKLERHHGQLDPGLPAATLERLVRAYHPWPGTTLLLPPTGTRPPRRLKILPPTLAIPASPTGGAAPGVGEIVHASPDGLDIATSEGTLRVLHVHPEGARPMAIADFLRGHPLPVSTILPRPDPLSLS